VSEGLKLYAEYKESEERSTVCLRCLRGCITAMGVRARNSAKEIGRQPSCNMRKALSVA
jgi:hypothetical protein